MRMITCEDKTELNAYALANIRIASHAVTRFLKRHPWATYLIDDIFSTALCKLFEALQTLVDKANHDPEGFWTDLGCLDEEGRFLATMYLYISIYRSVQKCFEEDAVQAISPEMTKRLTLDWLTEPTTIRKHKLTDGVEAGVEYNHFDLVYILNDALEYCQTDFERDIIRMRFENLEDPEIAESLECSQQWVHRTRQKIGDRYKRSLCVFPE
jgi:DNA-directed RNA polymerase specialized sigma subunit